MKTIIAGSRWIGEADLTKTPAQAAREVHQVREVLDREREQITEVVSGGAHGADKIGERWARAMQIPRRLFPADWTKGKQAGMIRNAEMAKYADRLIAFWDGESKGTRHMIRLMQNLKKPVLVVTVRKSKTPAKVSDVQSPLFA